VSVGFTEPVTASVDALGWMSGRWVGEHEADRIEEWWSEPYAGMMLGMFRWHRDGVPRWCISSRRRRETSSHGSRLIRSRTPLATNSATHGARRTGIVA
jgi:hypothetical protein